MWQGLAVVHVGGGERHRMHELALAVRADVRLHAEVPLVALLGLTHLGIARLVFVLGRGGGADDGGVHNGALRDLEAARLQVSPDLFEHPLAQIVFLQQVAKLADGGFVGHRLAPQINAREPAHRHRVVQRLFHRRIRQIEPVLQAVDSNHPLKLDGRAPVARLRIHREHQGAELVPRNNAIHLRQKLRSPCRLRVAFESRSSQCHLFHRSLLPIRLVYRLQRTRPSIR